MGSEMGDPATGIRAGRHLLRVFCRVGGGRRHGPVRVGCRGFNPEGDQFQGSAGSHAGIDVAGRRYFDHPWCVARIDQLHDRRGSATTAACLYHRIRFEPDELPVSAVHFSADARRDPGYFCGDCSRCTFDPAHCDPIRG